MQIIGQICAFGAPFGGLGATYDVHLRLSGKLVGDFLLVIIELFSLGAFVLSQFTRLTDGRTDGQTDGRTNAHRKDRVAYNAAVKTDKFRSASTKSYSLNNRTDEVWKIAAEMSVNSVYILRLF